MIINKSLFQEKKVQIRNYLLKIIDFLIPYSIVLAYVFFVIELYSYPGFLRKIILIDAKTFSTAVVIMLIIRFVMFCKIKIFNKRTQTLIELVFNVNELFFPAMLFLYILFTSIESMNYPNYIFANFHIHPNFFLFLLVFNSGIVLIKLIHSHYLKVIALFNKYYRVNRIEITLIMTIIFCLTFIMIQSVLGVSRVIFNNIVFRINHPFLSYDQKIAIVVTDYPYYQFLNDHVPPNGSIGFPPQEGPWLTIGNLGYIRYFLYPRKLVQMADRDSIPKDVDYLLIARGEWASPDGVYGWPQATVSAKKAWFFDKKDKTITTKDDIIFDLKNHPEWTQSWGLLQIKD